jgi:hypothetical protein
MKIFELQGFSELRLPASDPDFDRSPGKFDRNLPESDAQLRVKDVERMANNSGDFLARPTSSLVRNKSRSFVLTTTLIRSAFGSDREPELSTKTLERQRHRRHA